MREAGKVTAVSESERVLKIYHTIMESMTTMMNMFSLFALLLGAVLIYNLMNISLRERQHEFGTMLIMGTNYQELENIITFEQKVVFTLGILFGYPLTSFNNFGICGKFINSNASPSQTSTSSEMNNLIFSGNCAK